MKTGAEIQCENYYKKFRVYKALDWKKRQDVDLLMIEQLRLKPSERISFEQIVSYVTKERKVINISNGIVIELRTKKLKNEVILKNIKPLMLKNFELERLSKETIIVN